MQWFQKLSARAKLLMSFTAVAGITVIVGYIGLSKMATINGMLNVMYERELRGLSEMKSANLSILSIGRAARQIVIEPDQAEMERLAGEIEQRAKEFSEQLNAVEATLVTAEAKAAIGRLGSDFPTYHNLIKQVVQKSMTNDNDGARELLRSGRSMGDKLEEAIATAVQMKEKLAEEAYTESDVVYASARNLVIGLIIGGAVLGLALGALIARWFTVALLEVAEIANSLASASQQLSAASEEISSGAQEQASNLEETASSLEEITSTVKQNADNAQQANQLANGSREVAEKGGEVVSNAVEGMNEINKASKKIADIITAIDEIAFQTNLLALNAAVEAARAGEQGRGFAVVAGEVRNLAQRSAAAAKEIKGLIQDSVRKVETGSELVNQSGQTLQEIVTSVKRVTDIVAEIAAASREQSSGIDQVSRAVAQMDQVTQANASQTEELSSTAQALAAQAQQLQDVVGRFNLDQAIRKSKLSARSAVTVSRSGSALMNGLKNGSHKFATNGKSHKTESPAKSNGDHHELDLVGAGNGRLNGHFEEF